MAAFYCPLKAIELGDNGVEMFVEDLPRFKSPGFIPRTARNQVWQMTVMSVFGR